MAVIRVNLFSMYLKQNMDCIVILPEELPEEGKLKTLWLYHGGSGDHTGWLYHTAISTYADEGGFAAVLPNVHESCMVDMNIGGKYGTYAGDELPQIIYGMFPILSDKREDNFISGFSNGGYGSLHIALKYPHRFGTVGAFSAGDKADAKFQNDGSLKSLNRIRLFGEGDLNGTDYGIKYQARRLASIDCERPRIYHACGSEDPWLDMNLLVKECFESMPQQYEYVYDQIENTGHVWSFWEEELLRFLEYTKLRSRK